MSNIGIAPKSVYVAYTNDTAETYTDVSSYKFEKDYPLVTFYINESKGLRVVPLSSIKFVEIEF